MNNTRYSLFLTLLLCLNLTGCLSVGNSGCDDETSCPAVAGDRGNNQGNPLPDAADKASARWISTWGTAIYTTFPNGPLTQPEFSPNAGLFIGEEAWNQSFRMMIHPTAPGNKVRFHFSNTYGEQPLELSNANVATRAGAIGPGIVADTLTPLTFDGESSVTIPVGETITTDPADFSYEFGDTLAVSFHIPGPSGAMSWHAESFALQYASVPNSGDVTRDELGVHFGNSDRGWFFLRGMDIQLQEPVPETVRPGTIVAFGDSITDGLASTPEMNERWPDFLARRIQAEGLPIGVVNAGINSNTVTGSANPEIQGEAGVLRFSRDALERAGVRTVFVLLGTNDIRNGVSADDIYRGLVNLAIQAHERDVRIVVSTILPRNDPPVPFGWDPTIHEPVRQALNDQILNSDAFDAVVDLASVMENPLVENQPFQPYFVEGLHPNSVGMEVMANAIPLDVLMPELAVAIDQ